MLMTASDLSGGTKKWECHYRVSNIQKNLNLSRKKKTENFFKKFKLSQQVSDEFFNEGDLEKEKFKKEPIDSMNRNKSEQLPKIQMQFLQTVCFPLYKVIFITFF